MRQYECLSKEQKEELVEKAYRLDYEYEQECGCCSQCTVAAIQDTFGILGDDLFKAVYGLGAGIGLTGKGSCGALTAGVLVVGALRGRDRTDFRGGRNPQCYPLARELLERFESKYGGGLCSGVQEHKFGRSFDLTDRLQRFAFEEAGGHRDKCPEVVGTAARWVAEMIVNGEFKGGLRKARRGLCADKEDPQNRLRGCWSDRLQLGCGFPAKGPGRDGSGVDVK